MGDAQQLANRAAQFGLFGGGLRVQALQPLGFVQEQRAGADAQDQVVQAAGQADGCRRTNGWKAQAGEGGENGEGETPPTAARGTNGQSRPPARTALPLPPPLTCAPR